MSKDKFARFLNVKNVYKYYFIIINYPILYPSIPKTVCVLLYHFNVEAVPYLAETLARFNLPGSGESVGPEKTNE